MVLVSCVRGCAAAAVAAWAMHASQSNSGIAGGDDVFPLTDSTTSASDSLSVVWLERRASRTGAGTRSRIC